MNMILYISDEYCSSVEQLKGYFEMPLTADCNIYADLLDYGRNGDIAKWLEEMGEQKLAANVGAVKPYMSDSDYFGQLKKAVTGSKTGLDTRSLKLPFEKCFKYKGIGCANDNKGKKTVTLSLEVLKRVNETYQLSVESSYGIEREIIKSSQYAEGDKIKVDFTFYEKSGKDWVVMGVNVDGNELLSQHYLQKLPGFSDIDFVEAIDDLSFKMIKVKGGTFIMGATSEQPFDEISPDETPLHQVTLRDYYISETVVTQMLWEKIMGTTLRQQRDKYASHLELRGEGAKYPMYFVSWLEAKSFCEKLSEKTGRNYRLPTEAEWEYAARGGHKRPSARTKYSGSDDLDSVAWYDGNSSSKTHPVGGKSPNELGLYDMSGNVREWCSDWYGYYPSAAQTNPTGPSTGSKRVARGGNWSSSGRYCRVSAREYIRPGTGNRIIGFRLVCF